MTTMDEAVQGYIDRIAAEHRPLFDRLHRLILDVHPDATVVLSYKIPTYKVGNRRLHVGAWKHGLSLYGWQQGRDDAFISRHRRSRRAKEPCSCGPRTQQQSPMASSATLCALPWIPDKGTGRHWPQAMPAANPGHDTHQRVPRWLRHRRGAAGDTTSSGKRRGRPRPRPLGFPSPSMRVA